ncbi:hypothetical protein SAMN00120144_1925 [Hymenobacter roseosalivarius DSM 11622]|uniref:Lipoprotein n=1 Tax=Hymenobacter roseosalivarius DSM 11622 TaxID=645990 RepID=A0A1W1W4J7_9BACT|nr:hypothetical protein [Hymenobacter roseosalivarius]SMC00311.1 hypothetical protein SAMN00120144_1925 [Hymenobacter roseosalivarius DSM 11622]
MRFVIKQYSFQGILGGILVGLSVVGSGCDSQRTVTEGANPAAPSAEATVPISFQKEVAQNDYRFSVQTTGTGTKRILSLRAAKDNRELYTTSIPIEGEVSDAVATNLNDDKYPELFIFVAGAGSGSYGRLVGYEFINQGHRPLTLPELSGPAAAGYMGQDAFRVEGRQLLRSFPVYRPDDPNSTPSGGIRTVTYTMEPGMVLAVAGFNDAPARAQ